ncbi:hypothetical protein N2152v2_003036 [Parachlorella kessleri]
MDTSIKSGHSFTDDKMSRGSPSQDLQPQTPKVAPAMPKGPYQQGKNSTLRYGITDIPRWWECVLLGLQHFLTMLGSTILIPLIIVPAMGGTTNDLAKVINTCFFAGGINTLVQTIVGGRLPIVQGGSFAYITPALAIAGTIQTTMTFESDHDRFLYTMRVFQGGIIGSSFFIIAAGALGFFTVCMRFISPLTIAANISVLGLALYGAGFPSVGACVQLGLVQIVLLLAFSLYMRRLKIFGMPIFAMFPVILAIGITWLYAYIMTVAGVYDDSKPETQQSCTTWASNNGNVLSEASWFRVPYPGQWGAPIFTSTGVFTMLAGAVPVTLESLGDYFASAQLSNAPPPPPDVIGRAVGAEGVCCCISGVLGTTTGSSAYAENVGAIGITGVGSRRVIQTGAGIIIVISVIGKFGALFASIPNAMVAGLFCVMFSLISGVGLSNLQHIDLNSSRNLLILGFGLYMGLSIPDYFSTYTAAHGHGPINTGDQDFNNVMNSIFSTAAAVTLIITLFLDNTVPGGKRERGLHIWEELMASLGGGEWWEDEYMEKIYGWPFGLTPKWRRFKAKCINKMLSFVPARIRNFFSKKDKKEKDVKQPAPQLETAPTLEPIRTASGEEAA